MAKEKERPAGPQIPRRADWEDVPEYPGFKVRVWRNPPQKLWLSLFEGGDTEETRERRLEGLKQIFPEHNGWLDFEGNPYPPAGTREFWDEIPTELAVILLGMASRLQEQLPNSLTAARRR